MITKDLVSVANSIISLALHSAAFLRSLIVPRIFNLGTLPKQMLNCFPCSRLFTVPVTVCSVLVWAQCPVSTTSKMLSWTRIIDSSTPDFFLSYNRHRMLVKWLPAMFANHCLRDYSSSPGCFLCPSETGVPVLSSAPLLASTSATSLPIQFSLSIFTRQLECMRTFKSWV